MLIIPSALVGEKLASCFLSTEVGDKKWTYFSFLLCLSVVFFLKESAWNLLSRAVQTWPELDNLAKPPDADPILARTKGPVDRWRVPVLKNWHGESSGRFASPKLEQPELNRSCTKNLAKSWKIKLDPMRSWPYLVRSQPNPTRSSGI